MDTQEIIKGIKREFMAFRNGIVADTLRSAGMNCYRVIFGLNLPQLSQVWKSALRSVAESGETDNESGAVASAESADIRKLAEALWADRGVRESRLLACYAYGAVEDLTRLEAETLIADLQTREEAEILCLRTLRQRPYAAELAEAATDAPLQAHLARILRRHLEG